MLLRSALVATTFGLFAGCGMLGGGSTDNGGDNNGGGGGGSDTSQMMLDSAKGQPTQYIMQLPPNPKVGMWWEHTASGTSMKYAITKAQDDKLVVEQEQDFGGTMLVNAWLVDPSVDTMAMPAEGEKMPANVTKAWVGIKGKEAHERKVMDAPVYKKTEGGQEVDYTEGDEQVKMAGKTWDAHWVESGESKTWTVKGTSFLLKSMYQGKVSMELKAVGGDAETMLKWDGGKEEMKEEGK
ncbi:MAG: hypothetical protein R3F62_09710 [Planctomycetota bacterium]